MLKSFAVAARPRRGVTLARIRRKINALEALLAI
jgi:hypothetical protein